MMVDCNLSFVKSVGHYFSWHSSSGTENRILSRIDHGIVNDLWMLNHSETVIQYLHHGISDHTLLLLVYGEGVKSGSRPFRFFNHLLLQPKFEEKVKDIWSRHNITSMKDLWNVLRQDKQNLKEMNVSEFKGVEEKIVY